jgi:AraC-like DNA-binding protein
LKKRDTLRPKRVKPRGILHLPASHPLTGYARYWPDSALAPFVEHLWTVEWDLPAPSTSEVLAHPSVQLVIERDASRVGGVHTGLFTRRLEGRGRVLGVKFRPGGFRPFLGRAVSELTDRMTPIAAIFGDEARGLEERALARPDHGEAFAEIQAFLARVAPPPDPTVDLLAALAERIATDRGITRVEQLVPIAGLPLRKLQRLFDDWVGVAPKWVIQRYRLHEAAERIALATPEAALDWADLALELGYADQAHFIRDFRKLVGRTPGDYAKSLFPAAVSAASRSPRRRR